MTDSATTDRPRPVLPGAAIGVLGSGQLGRMFAIAARRMGYRVHTYSPEADTPTGQVADVEINGRYDDLDAVRSFASAVQVVTFEFENVPSLTVQAAAEHAAVRPAGSVPTATARSSAGWPPAIWLAAVPAAAPPARPRRMRVWRGRAFRANAVHSSMPLTLTST